MVLDLEKSPNYLSLAVLGSIINGATTHVGPVEFCTTDKEADVLKNIESIEKLCGLS
jgi:hypothetical protein